MENKKLISVAQWTIYIFLVIIVLLPLVSLFVSVLAPTFFPSADISGFKDYIDAFAIILSFLSVALGGFSIWQSHESGKQANKVLDSINDIKIKQDTLLVTLMSTSNISSSETLDNWVHDDVTK